MVWIPSVGRIHPSLLPSKSTVPSLQKTFDGTKETTGYAAFQRKTQFPIVGCEQNAVFVDIPVEDILQFVGHLPVKDECIHFEVIAKRTRIQIGCSYGAEESVHHHYLAVMETAVVIEHFGSMFHQFVHLLSHHIGCDGAVAHRGCHYLNPHSTLKSSYQRAMNALDHRGIWVHYLNEMLGVVDSYAVGFSDHFRTFTGNPFHQCHGHTSRGRIG